MGLLRTLIWSALCIGLGIFLGTYSFSGRTAVEHAERSLQGDVKQVLEEAKKKLATTAAPVEKHTAEDKEAVNQIIARRKPAPSRAAAQ